MNRIIAFSLFLFSVLAHIHAEDSPQWGEKHTRNMVSPEKNLPDTFEPGRRNPVDRTVDPSGTKNVRWTAKLGKVVYGTPVIAEGKVLIGTADSVQEDRPQLEGDRGVLVCLNEKSGELLWELVVPKFSEIRYSDWYRVGIVSAPVIEDGKAYIMSNRCEVISLDMNGLADGNTGPFLDEANHSVPGGSPPLELTEKDADIIWICDLYKTLGVMPHNASNCSILLDGNLLYVCTGNGVDWTHRYVMNPAAPSLVVIDKRTGKVVAKDDFRLGPNIIHGQWSSPSMGIVDGKKLVFQGTGSGHLFAVEALREELADAALESGKIVSLKTIWKFNGHPLAQIQEVVPLEHFHDTKSYEVIGNPVFYKDRVYVVFTQELFHNLPNARLVCINARGNGDITRSGGLIWKYDEISSSCSTVAIADGLLYITDRKGILHALNAETGEPYWTHAIGGPIWGSPLLADGKIYIGNERRNLWIMEHGKEPKVLARITMPDKILSSVTAANGTLYVPLFGTLYAIENPSR